MRSFTLSFLTFLILITAASFQKADKLTILSSAFTEGGMIPIRYTCEGDNINPPLQVSGLPESTKSLAIIVFEPDAHAKNDYTHWVAWNLPLSGNIPENYKGNAQGLNGARKYGYTGMCPIAEGVHHFCFRAYALDTVLDISKNITKTGMEKIIKGHILAMGELNGTFAQGDVTIPTKTSTIATIPAETPKAHKKHKSHHRIKKTDENSTVKQ